jgi:hypothetical protein
VPLGPRVIEMDAEQRSIRQRYKDDRRHFAERCLKIRAKSGELVPFAFNGVQDYVDGRLDQQLRDLGKVRALVLKARQEGLSTYIGGRYYHQVIHRRGCQVFILTHEQDATNNLFGMVERFHRHNKPGIGPRTGASNAKELYFPGLDSGYSVGTAGSKAVGRSKTVQLFHGSEVAFWPNAKDHFAGVMQTVPDMAGTEIVLESTANGIGGEFHERWQQAEAGDGDYLPLFVPWFWSTEYARSPPLGFELNDEEEEYGAAYGLSLEQLVWRRAKLAELKDPNLFRQEYPATAAEAFQATGHDAFIPSQLVLQARKRTCEAIGSLVIGVDPARFGDDGFAIAWRQGRRVLKVERRHKLDTVQGANWVRQIIDRDGPAKVFLDVGGSGAGVVDLLKDWGEPYAKLCEGVNFGGTPQEPTSVGSRGEVVPGPRNRRAEMWMRSKDWLLDPGGADLPDDDALHADAVAPSYKYDARQFLQLEKKEDIRKRGLRSPDGWDAVALTFAAPVRSGGGSAASDRWKRWKGMGRGVRSVWGG